MSTDAAPLPDPALLPDDVAVLKQLVVQLLEQLRLRDERLERQEHHIHLLLKRIYGSTSEKFDPRQGMLFDRQAGGEEVAANSPAPPPVARPVSQNRDKHGRGRIPDETKREELVHDLSPAEKAALGGAENLVELPPETSEQLDWRPSTLFVVVHVRKKYARKEQLPESGLTLAEQNVVVARKPPEAIPGGLAGPGLMAQVIVSKGADHLPLHRLEGIFQRQGVRISRQTMDGWWLQTADFLQPLYALAIYLGSGGRIVEVACWAHARRKFHESRRLDPARMETALAWIGKLYAIEKELRQRCQGQWQPLTLEERAGRIAAERQERSRPLLAGFHTWLEAESLKVLPKSAVRGAMDYTLSNWAALSVYVEDGWLDIDNNEGENSLRGLCIGRRNWLFCGSDRGGRAAAIHFSLLASCKRHGHDPWVYLRDVLTRLPAMLPGASDEELLALLPHRWRPA
jgi:transposase